MHYILRIALAAACLGAGAMDAQGADSVGLLGADRIAALPAAERQAWERYVETSRRMDPDGELVIARRIRSLARTGRASADEGERRTFLRGLGFLLQAQYPNGCWPAAYPLRGGGSDAVTFAEPMLEVLALLRNVTRGGVAWVADTDRRRAAESLARGVECVLRGQRVVDGRRAGWSALYDPLTMAPIREPGSEFAALGARETAGLLALLMELDAGDPRVAASVRGAVAWLRETMLWGLGRGPDEALVMMPGAGPVWARAYEPGGNRPMFVRPDGTVRNDPRALADSAGAFAWFTGAPADVLARYAAWPGARASRPLPPPPTHANVVVDARHGGPDGEIVGGTPMYRTIGAALAVAPEDGARAFVIHIRDGRYREKLSIQTANIHLVGESRDGTVLTHDVAAGHLSPGGWPYGTRGSWTLHVAAPGFRLERMTVENGFDYMANFSKPDSDATKLRGMQAVAVMLDEGSDRAVFRDCRLSGHQDTLFPNAGRSYFQRCEILGSVDFIFGAGRAVFDDCDIVSRDRGDADNGYVTAPSTPIAQPYGFLFVGGRLKKETPSMAPGSVTLGRPWHPSGRPDAIGSAVFIGTWMDDHVGAAGWSPMTSTDAAGTRVEHQPGDARFFEHGTTGPGAVPSPTRRVLTAEQAASYSIPLVLDGWDPRQ